MMLKNQGKSYVLLLLSFLSLATQGCAQKIYRYHTVYELKECKKDVSRSDLRTELLRDGFYRKTENKEPYEIFKKPNILKKGILAAEPYEDRSGEFGLAYCKGEDISWIALEEIKSCEKLKDCTAINQQEVKATLEKFGCQLQEKQALSESWRLESRQDWTVNTCKNIVTSLQ